MFNDLFTSPQAVDRYSSGPLLDERLRYLAHRAEQGSTRSSLRLTAQQQLVAIDYLHMPERDSVTVKEIEAAADLWICRQSQPYTHSAIDYRWARLRFISEARQWLSFLGRLRPIEAPRRPYADLIERFTVHMIREKGLSQYTVRIRCWYLEQFLNRFWKHHRSFDEVTIADVDAAVARKGRMATPGPRSKVTLTHSGHFSAMPSNVVGVVRDWRRP